MRNRMGSSLNLDTTVVGLQGLPISSTPPTSGQALVFDGTNWVPTTVATGGAIVPVNNVLPASPSVGELYWDLTTAKLFLWDGTQWVATINTPEGSVGPAGPAGPPGPSVMPPGVTDGSQAAPGQVGEILTATVPVSGALIPTGGNGTAFFSTVDFILGNALPLTNGDWQVYIDYNVTAPFSTPTVTEIYASMQSGAFGNIPGNLFRFFPGYQAPPATFGSSFISAGISGNYTFPQVTITDAAPSKAAWAQFNNFIIASTNVVLSGNAYFWARRMR